MTVRRLLAAKLIAVADLRSHTHSSSASAFVIGRLPYSASECQDAYA